MSRKFILLTETNGDIALVNVDLVEAVRVPDADGTTDLAHGNTWVEFASGQSLTVKESVAKIQKLIEEDDEL